MSDGDFTRHLSDGLLWAKRVISYPCRSEGNGLLLHMTQLINRSNTKSHCTISKSAVSEH